MHSPEVDALAQQTAELHIPDLQMATQIMEVPPNLVIDEYTGHVRNLAPEERIAAHRAMGPDEPDAPGDPSDNFFDRIG